MLQVDVSEGEFVKLFEDCGRGDNFSFMARRALFQYYEELYDGNYKVDIIGICCCWGEYSEQELFDNYDHLLDEPKNDLHKLLYALDMETMVLRVERRTLDNESVTSYLVHEF